MTTIPITCLLGNITNSALIRIFVHICLPTSCKFIWNEVDVHFQSDRYCSLPLPNDYINSYAHTWFYCENSPESSEESESLLLKGCFPVTDALQGLLCFCVGHWGEFFLNYQLWYFKTNTLHIMTSVNLYTVEVLLYICSRHLANYWGVKVCLGIKYTKVAIPFFLPRNMQWRTATGEERYTCCFFFLNTVW